MPLPMGWFEWARQKSGARRAPHHETVLPPSIALSISFTLSEEELRRNGRDSPPGVFVFASGKFGGGGGLLER